MMAATRWPWRATPSVPTWNTRCRSSKAVRCPMCATASSPCSGASCIRWTAWAWATAAPRATLPPSPSKAPAWWAMCWAASTPTVTSRPTTRWCAWRRILPSATRSSTARATLAAATATALPPCATPKRACPASPACCSMKSTKARSISCPTTTAARKSLANCPPVCPSRCSTAPAALPWAWPPRSPATTCARLPMRAWRSSRRHR